MIRAFAKSVSTVLISSILSLGAQAQVDPNQTVLEEYVRRAIESLPGSGLPAYAQDNSAWLTQLLDNVQAQPGLSQGWCGAAVDVAFGCQAWGITADLADYGFCGQFSPPFAVYEGAMQQATPLLGPSEVVRYVGFYNPLNSSGIYVFQISQVGAYGSRSYCSTAPNSVGTGARMDVSGSRSIADNSLVLTAGPVPDQVGLFLLGAQRVELPFGDGFRCVGGSIRRLPPVLASGGLLQYALDFTDPNSPVTQLSPGWQNVQAWYRDPAGVASGFNLSDGLALLLCP